MSILSKEELIKFIDANKSNFTKQLKFHHKDFYDQINTRYQYPEFAQKLYHYIHGEKVGKCKRCSSLSTFSSVSKGYLKYCSYKCSGNGKKEIAREVRSCKICNQEFEAYKKAKNQFCSDECRKTQNKLNAKERVAKSVEASIRNHGGVHHMSLPEHKVKSKKASLLKYGNENFRNIPKSKKTRLARYGDENYTNPEKVKETCLKRYGVKNIFLHRKSNGIGISKPQRKLYEMIKEKYPEAVLEYQIPELNISADIYIPERNLIVEFFGDYWHCNPKKYDSTYWHKYIHQTASEIWERDEARKEKLKELGFEVEIVWESDFPNNLHVI